METCRRYIIDSSAIVLNKLLSERNLDIWSRLKLAFLDPAFSSLYSAISKHYDIHGGMPSFEELELTLREGPALRSLATLKLVDTDEISSEVALNALIDQYTQNETVKLLDKFIDKLPIYDTAEIKENLSGIVLKLDEKTITTEGVYSMNDMMVFKSVVDLERERTHLGLNNLLDATLAGVARQELILVGGPRGSGKSIVCSNIQINQYKMGNVCPYFTIEMIGQEILERNMAILADVDYMHLKQNTLTDDELVKVVRARAEMFEDSGDKVREFLRHRDKYKFEIELVREKHLKQDNQLIIIDDRALTIAALDLHLGKIKAKFGDKFKVGVVDYLNQVSIDGLSMFDWQPQVLVSKKMKELARKHDVVLFSPYQVDAGGEARFAKGILDAADIAMLLAVQDNTITFSTTKIRGGPPLVATSPINFTSLTISPQTIDKPEAKETIKKAGKKKAQAEEPADDLKWDT